MSRKRPISYKLKKSSTREKQLEKAKEWAQQWHDDAIRLIHVLNDTAEKDWAAFDAAQDELRQMMHRKCEALPNIFDILTQPLYTERSEE